MTRKRSRFTAIGIGLFTALIFAASPASAGEDCECVGNGKKIKEGGVVCLQIGSSTRYLARCERNLNNTSWKKIADGCPTASMSPWPGHGQNPNS
jgi:hypothetical protein